METRAPIAVGIQRRMEQLFVLPRPHILFESRETGRETGREMETDVPGVLDSEEVILGGVRRRLDLFDPLLLVERIPVTSISLCQETRGRLRRLGLNAGERAFIEALQVPTPIPMVLWKRGLPPRDAGAMVMALNLIGAFENWRPGDLPRLSAAASLRRRIEGTSDDYVLLGVDTDAPIEEVDRAFRKLSYALHPDRVSALGEEAATSAQEAFQKISAAHARVRRSRRSKRCRTSTWSDIEVTPGKSNASPWLQLLEKARLAAAAGDGIQAKRLAIKAIALKPPKPIVEALKGVLKSVA